MNDRPDARELLAVARDTFGSEIMPVLPPKLRYTGLMIANALAIAQREIEAGDASDLQELERLRALLRESPAAVTGNALRATLENYNQRVARDIRAGRYDGGDRHSMFEHLHKTTSDKVAVTNPKALNRK